MTTTTNDLQTFLSKKIYHWVGRNFGSQEAENPSWNIEELSKYLAKEIGRKEQDDLNRHNYELTVIAREEFDTEQVMSSMEKLVRDRHGKVVSKQIDGRKRLPYPIANNEYGVYVFMQIALPPDEASSLNSALNIKDSILRYLLVKADARRR